MIKKKDLIIMSHLRRNARETLTSMSKRTQIPISTIFEKIKGHTNGLIKKHTTLIDFQRMGYITRANLLMKVQKNQRDDMKKHMANHMNINSLYKINNGYDFMAEAIFKNINDLEEFLDSLDDKFEILQKDVYYIIDDIKREAFMADPSILDLIAG